MRRHEDVVVRVRTIAADLAGLAAAETAAAAAGAAELAMAARRRAATHPLGGASRPLVAGDLMTAVGVGSTLRESALTAARRAVLADQVAEDARQAAQAAAAGRKAAERLASRRMEAVALHEQRRQQRLSDESESGRRGA